MKKQNLSAQQQEAFIDSISILLLENYIFPEVAEKMSAEIKKNLANNKYAGAESPIQFGRMVTQDLRGVSKDNHISITYRRSNQNSVNSEPDTTYGISRNEMLPGNIGYLKFDYFAQGSDEQAKLKFGSVFTSFKNANAILVDLTENFGGSTQMEAYLCSYFFNRKPRHLWDGYYRLRDTTYHFYTEKNLHGTRHESIPVYILISSQTFSAGEAFAYDLQAQQRAKIIGEISAGGAHPTAAFALGRFLVRIPVTKITNAVTKSDWEDVGVKPDISCIQYEAFDEAYLLSLKEACRSAKNPAEKKELENLIRKKEKEQEDFSKANEKLKEYEGSYGIRRIKYSKGKIYFQRENEPFIPMQPEEKDLFIWGDKRTKLKFNRNTSGSVIGFDIIRPNETIPVKRD